MADTDSISTSGEAEFFISEADITEAVKVIRPIPKLPTETATTIRFTVRRGGHCASIHVNITPFRLEGTTNRGFRASCRATPCHPGFNDSELYDQIQKVYDAIVPVQWTFDSDCTEIIRETPLTSDVPCCQHKTPYCPPPVELNGANQAPPPSSHSRPAPPSGLPRKRSHDEASIALGDAIVSKLPKSVESAEPDPKRLKSIQTIVDDFVSLIMKGQKLLKKKSARHLSGIQAILSRREQEDIKHVLGNLSKEFHHESKQKGIKSDSWDYWYFEGCMDLVNYTTGEAAKSTSAARAVRLVNSVVNRLLVTNGAIALVIFGALAETGARLTYISRADAKSRDTIVNLAVQHLHKKLHRPPSWYQIPNPAIWVALVKNRSGSGTPVYSFQDACRDLAFPNLAALDLKPQWVGDSSSKSLLMKVDFSLVEASWTATGVNAQQSMGSESNTTQPGSRSVSDSDRSSTPLEAGPVTPTAHAGPSFGDSSGPLTSGHSPSGFAVPDLNVESTLGDASPDGHGGQYLGEGSKMATARQQAPQVAAGGIGAQDVGCHDRDISVTISANSACGFGDLDPHNLGDVREILHGVEPESGDTLFAAISGVRSDPQIMLAPPVQPQSAELDNWTDHNVYNAPCWDDTTSGWDAFLVQEERCNLE